MSKEHRLGILWFAGKLTASGELLCHPALDPALMLKNGFIGDGAARATDGYEVMVGTSPFEVPLHNFLPLLRMDADVAKAVDVRAERSVVAIMLEVLTEEEALEEPSSFEFTVLG